MIGPGSAFGSLQTIVLDNDRVRVIVVPALGARVISLTDRFASREWLVAGDPPADPTPWAGHEAVFDGDVAFGWDECLPTDRSLPGSPGSVRPAAARPRRPVGSSDAGHGRGRGARGAVGERRAGRTGSRDVFASTARASSRSMSSRITAIASCRSSGRCTRCWRWSPVLASTWRDSRRSGSRPRWVSRSGRCRVTSRGRRRRAPTDR